jgi:hypothetical protein
MRQTHEKGSHEAKKLLVILPLDEAEKTLRDYNKNIVCKRYCWPGSHLEREEELGLEVSSNCSTNSTYQNDQRHLQTEKQSQTEVKNKKFKCVQCIFRSNSPTYVTIHFIRAHQQYNIYFDGEIFLFK